MVARHASIPIPRTYLEIKRSKVKVTRPTNAETGSASYLPNGRPKNFKLGTQTEHEDRASATRTITSKVKGGGRKVT